MPEMKKPSMLGIDISAYPRENYSVETESENSETIREEKIKEIERNHQLHSTAFGYSGKIGFHLLEIDQEKYVENHNRSVRLSASWGDPEIYGDLIVYLIAASDNYSFDELKSLVDKVPNDEQFRAKRNPQYLTDDGIKYLLDRIRESAIGHDHKVTEIGGSVFSECARKLGFDAQDNNRSIISVDSWNSILMSEQDVVATSWVFDAGSGISSIAKPGSDGGDIDEMGAKELLLVIYNILKKNGLSINEWFKLYLTDNSGKYFPKEIGLQPVPVPKDQSDGSGLTVFIKARPSVNEVRIGAKHFQYDEQEDSWKQI